MDKLSVAGWVFVHTFSSPVNISYGLLQTFGHHFLQIANVFFRRMQKTAFHPIQKHLGCAEYIKFDGKEQFIIEKAPMSRTKRKKG